MQLTAELAMRLWSPDEELGLFEDETFLPPRKLEMGNCGVCRDLLVAVPIDLELNDGRALMRDIRLPFCRRCRVFRFPPVWPLRRIAQFLDEAVPVVIEPTGAFRRTDTTQARSSIAVECDVRVVGWPQLVIRGVPAVYDIGTEALKLSVASADAAQAVLDELAAGPRLTGLVSSAEYGAGPHPRVLKVETTTHCNLRCVFCTNPQLTNRMHMSFETFERLWGMVDASAVVKVGFTGLGETLLNRDFWKIHGLVKRAGLATSLVSNGTRIARQAPTITESGLDHLAVSIETLDPDRYARQRRGGDLSRVLQGIDQVLAERDRRGSHLQVHVLSVLVGTSAADEERLIDLCAERGLPPPRFYPPYLRFIADDVAATATDLPSMERHYRRVEQLVAARYGVPCARAPREVVLLRRARAQRSPRYEDLRCTEPATVFVIRANGTWTYCNEGIFEIAEAEGNRIASYPSVAAIWRSKDYRRFRLGIATASLPRMCEGCAAAELPLALS